LIIRNLFGIVTKKEEKNKLFSGNAYR
jgi:hypothetical protein